MLRLSDLNPLELLAEHLSGRLGVDVFAIRYLLSIVLGYPIAIIYVLFIRDRGARACNIYMFLTGLVLSVWNFGLDVVHLFAGIALTISTLRLCGPTSTAVAMTFLLNMVYLLIGYYWVNYGTYDINWTMSYCILCLRLIGFAWDYRDGALPETKLSEYQKSAAFTDIPSSLEILAFCFVPTACFVGPQFTWRHYQSFIDQTLRPAVVLKNRTITQKYFRNPKLHRTLSRLATGIIFMILHLASRSLVPMEYMLTDEFLKKSNFFYRLGYMCAFSQFLIMRYLCIWLFGEGSCVLMGLGCTGNVHVQYLTGGQSSSPSKNYTGTVNTSQFRKTAVLGSGATVEYDFQALEKDVQEGRAVVTEADHTKCANISVVRFLSATNTDLLVSSFNINTNKWMLEYVYKRLRFLGNKQLSQSITLLFLAVWHGFYSGYYVNFFLEFITIYAEKELLYIVRHSIYTDFLYKTLPGQILTSIVGKLHVLFLLGCPMVAFALLRANLWIPVLSSVYFVGFIYLLWPLGRPLVKRLFPRKPEIEAKKDS